jgi:ABC-2 type transport system permease protein
MIPLPLVRITALARKEALHIQRDPRTFILGLVLPLVMLMLFGFGISLDVDHIPVAVSDLDRTPESRALIDLFTQSSTFVAAGEIGDPDDAARVFARGQATVILTIPRGYARALARGEHVDVGLLVDGADGQSAQTALAQAEVLGQVASARAAAAQLSTLGAGATTPVLSTRAWLRFNPTGRSALFLVPGVTAYVLALVAVLLTALSVAREWENGSMEQLFATPVNRSEIIIGKLAPYMLMGVVQVLLVLVAGAWVFGVPTRGDLGVLAVASLLFVLGMLGQGLLISVVARNQLVATQLSAMSSLLPSMLLSGFLFPIAGMPWPLQLASRFVPARYYVQVLRGVLLKGNGVAEQGPAVAALAVFAAAMIVLSTARFKRKLA